MDRKRARRVTFRVRKAMMKLTRRLAIGMGSTLAELGQVMIMIGAVCEFVQFEDSKHFGEFVSAARLSRRADGVDEQSPFKETLGALSDSVMQLLSGPGRNRRYVEGSELMKVRLPDGFLERVDLYAKLTKASRSAILTRFFQRGLLIYMRSEGALMKALTKSLSKHEGEPSGRGGS
jgi:hypothetical protein